jgi:hypothetical protein
LEEISLDIAVPTGRGPVPENLGAAKFSALPTLKSPVGVQREWVATDFAWEAPGLCHRPLYFEEVNLERHGYSHGVTQPFYSAAHFFGRMPLLPYMIAAEPPRECVYTLGHYRPGTPAPYVRYGLPLSTKAGLVEGGVVTGLFFLIP